MKSHRSISSITCFCLDWHKNFSNAFNNILVEPLLPYVTINTKSWDGIGLEQQEISQLNKSVPIIFAQLPPPKEILEKQDYQIIWIPMWDHAKMYSDDWWNSLPKNMKIIAFSDAIWLKAKKAGLKTIRLKYFKNPEVFEKCNWNNGRIALYWNRTGMISPKLIIKITEILELKQLLFLSCIDPRIPTEAHFELPKRIRKTDVITFDKLMAQSQYLQLLSYANIFVSPRVSEGVGMTFLEAMATGCAVLAYDAPSMNEYISSGLNGFLISAAQSSIISRIKNYSIKFINNQFFSKPSFPFTLTEGINLNFLLDADLFTIGKNARESQLLGYYSWKQQIPEYASFILER